MFHCSCNRIAHNSFPIIKREMGQNITHGDFVRSVDVITINLNGIHLITSFQGLDILQIKMTNQRKPWNRQRQY